MTSEADLISLSVDAIGADRTEIASGAACTSELLDPQSALVTGPESVSVTVLCRMLSRCGVSAQVATDPHGFRFALGNLRPACVFIDCDGNSDGSALAREIRQSERPGEHHVLIALTGSTSREQRKIRKAAGFTNYVAKPIRQDVVRALLARNSLGNLRDASRTFAIDHRVLNEIGDLLDWDRQAVEGLYRRYLASTSEWLSQMRNAIEEDDAVSITGNAQQIRTASGQVGATRVQDICVGIEALAQGGLLKGADALVQDLAVAFEGVSREIFSADFSRFAEQPGQRSGEHEGRRAALVPGRVLLAEPDRMTSRFLTAALEGAGFSVVCDSTGSGALEQALAQPFQAIILGTGLPGRDGYNVLSELRLRGERQRTPVILVSSSNQENDLMRAFDLGADEYLVKPLNPLEVIARLRRCLR